MADLKALADAVIKGDQNTAAEITKAALDEGTSAEICLNKGLIAAMDVVGDRFSKNEIYIPEILIAARAMITPETRIPFSCGKVKHLCWN